MTAAGAKVSILRAVVRVLFVVIVLAAAATARALIGGERAIGASTEALRAGDPFAAADHARAAATWYVPGAPHVRVAYGRLMALAREAEQRRMRELALHAYRAVVTASTSTSWIVTPHAADAEAARAAIARLESRGERPIATATEPPEAIERAQLEALAASMEPSRPAAVALVAGFVATLGGLALVLLQAFDETGRLHARRAALGTAVAFAGAIVYALTLWLA